MSLSTLPSLPLLEQSRNKFLTLKASVPTFSHFPVHSWEAFLMDTILHFITPVIRVAGAKGSARISRRLGPTGRSHRARQEAQEHCQPKGHSQLESLLERRQLRARCQTPFVKSSGERVKAQGASEGHHSETPGLTFPICEALHNKVVDDSES